MKPQLSDDEWRQMTNVAYVGPAIKTRSGGYVGAGATCLVRRDTAWALLRFFREGVDWGSVEVMRQWAEEEYAAFVEREREKLPKPKLVE